MSNTPSILPSINALLNATAAILLVIGYLSIRRGRRVSHGWLMGSAFGVSAVFLICYLYYHATHGSTRFPSDNPLRPVYLAILLSHTILAMVAAPLAVYIVYLAARRRFATHRRFARWTFPIWLYVSVTGVAVYWMLYHLAAR